ncbi:MAG: hypothetical protein JNK87_30075 [Bryobacterales bacterium]|nr:hypothetical protein [Bryobacterales bacterium]
MANVLIWRCLQLEQLPLPCAAALLALLALGAGALAPQRPGGALAMILTPVLFIGGARHGRPIDWILGIPQYPPILLYLAQQTTPIILPAAVLVWLGARTRQACRVWR